MEWYVIVPAAAQHTPLPATTPFAAGEPTDQLIKVRGIKTTKKLKAGDLRFPVIMAVEELKTLMSIFIILFRIKRPVAGKTIIRVPKVGGLFSVEQLPQSEAWPALKFMIDQA
jgi:hypothetical protein